MAGTDEDFVSIDGASDADFFSFDVTQDGVSLTQGTYFIQVLGSQDRAQFYSITSNFTVPAVPEPSSFALGLFAMSALAIRRKRLAL